MTVGGWFRELSMEDLEKGSLLIGIVFLIILTFKAIRR
jgi:hypothetical protein